MERNDSLWLRVGQRLQQKEEERQFRQVSCSKDTKFTDTVLVYEGFTEELCFFMARRGAYGTE